MAENPPWHQLFGLSWVDFFRGTAVTVEREKDLSENWKKPLEGLSIDEILKTLPPEKRSEGMSPEERVTGLSAEELEALAKRMRENGGQPQG
jgi:hypothetical protein